MSTTGPERDELPFDVVIVGAGPAGLATAIRLKQLAPAAEIAVLEKGSEVGAHILSGAVIDPVGLDALVPGWRDDAALPPVTEVTADEMLWLTSRGRIKAPSALIPRHMSNHGNVIASLGALCRWLATWSEALGVTLLPGFPGADLAYDAEGAVRGVVAGDTGRNRDGTPGPDFQPGPVLAAKYTVFAEGARGSLTKAAIARFGLDAGRGPQKYGLGFKEIWRVPGERHRPGLVQHTLGWPLPDDVGGGGFVYHAAGGEVFVGFVVHLDYADPRLSPFELFQRFKSHPMLDGLLRGGERIAYGARAIAEGGWQSVPRMAFPGGLLAGDAAGLVNLPRIKGSHNALLSGIAAGEAIAAALAAGRANDTLDAYADAWRNSQIGTDLGMARNVKPLWSGFGTRVGVPLGALDLWCRQLLGGSPFGTLSHRKSDFAATRPAAGRPKAVYPKPDGVVTFDRLGSVHLSNLSGRDGQPPHLKVGDPARLISEELGVFAGPSARYCPAAVYEWREGAAGPEFVINAGNCVHCKTCDIKDPAQTITWTPPEGGSGPNYGAM